LAKQKTVSRKQYLKGLRSRTTRASRERYRARFTTKRSERAAPRAQPGTPPQAATPPYLEPDVQGRFDEQFFGILGQGIENEQALKDLEAGDPLVRQQIQDNYTMSLRKRGEELAARGLSAAGVSNAQVWDVDRARDLANTQQDTVLSRARARFTAVKANLDAQLTALQNWRVQATTPGTAGTPGAPAGGGPPAGGGRPATPGAGGKGKYVLRPKPGRSTFLAPGQQLIGPASGTPGGTPGSKVIRLGLGGDKRYTLSPTPGGRTRVTRIRQPRPRRVRR